MAKKYITGFPQTQAQMAEWREKYKFETATGKWYEPLEPSVKKIDTEARKAQIQTGIKAAQEQAKTIQAGISALAEIDTAGAPPIDTVAGDIGAVGNGLVAQDTQMQELIKTLTKQAEEAAKRAETAQKGILATITKRAEVRKAAPSIEEATRTALAEYGLTPESVQKVQGWMGQLTTYNQQMSDLEAQKNAALGREEGRMGLEGVVRGRMAIIEKQYNSRISAKAAQAGVVSQQIQMERGIWDQARITSNQIIQAVQYDRAQELADLSWAKETYQDLYQMATAEERTAWDRSYDLVQRQYNEEKEEWERKLDMRVTAAQQGVDLGWNVQYMQDTSVDELTTEYSKRIAEQVRIEKAKAKEYAPPEIQREWEAAGGEIGTGMSLVDYISWRTGRGAPDVPKVWTDEELRNKIRQMQADGLDYQTSLSEIDMATTISNKDRARLIASELYKVAEPGVIEEIAALPPEQAGKRLGEYARYLPEAIVETVTEPYKKGFEFWKGVISPLYTE